MYHDQLIKDIQKITEELQRLLSDKNNLSDPEIVSKSRVLDKLLVDYRIYVGKNRD
ncbi:MAG: aspartyl-phosphate phosphatase Spo0E family protein [Bacillota bacterium]